MNLLVGAINLSGNRIERIKNNKLFSMFNLNNLNLCFSQTLTAHTKNKAAGQCFCNAAKQKKKTIMR